MRLGSKYIKYILKEADSVNNLVSDPQAFQALLSKVGSCLGRVTGTSLPQDD